MKSFYEFLCDDCNLKHKENDNTITHTIINSETSVISVISKQFKQDLLQDIGRVHVNSVLKLLPSVGIITDHVHQFMSATVQT